MRLAAVAVLLATSAGPYNAQGYRTDGGPQRDDLHCVGSPQQIGMCLTARRYDDWHSQYACMDDVVTRESGWDIHATNRSSGAYGAPQALPGSKMASAGEDWRDSPRTQLIWFIDHYTVPRYGSPCGAWDFWQRHGWY